MSKHTVVTHSCVARTASRDGRGGVEAVLRITPPIIVGEALLAIGGPTNMAQRIDIRHIFSDKDNTFLRIALTGATMNDLDVEQIRARIQDVLQFPERIVNYTNTALA